MRMLQQLGIKQTATGVSGVAYTNTAPPALDQDQSRWSEARLTEPYAEWKARRAKERERCHQRLSA